MARVVATAPTYFDVQPFAGRWFHWSEINACFWPGPGGRAVNINPELAPVRHIGGVYCFAWSPNPPQVIGPIGLEVKYIGESSKFQRRIGQFGDSAGFWGERRDGHSAAWRWPFAQTANTWVSFFPLGGNLLGHLAEGLRHWMEGLALEEYRLLYNRLPEINEAKSELEKFNAEQGAAADRPRD